MRTESLFDSFRAHARQRPDATALVWRGERVSYGRLAHWVERARAVVDTGPARTDTRPVCVVAEKSPAAIAVVLACLATGQSVLAVSPALPRSTLELLSDRAGCRTVLTPERIAAAVADRPDDVRVIASPHVVGEEDLTFILTTSGSTGVPKLVPLTAGAVDRFTEWAAERFGIRPGTAVLNYAPLNFDLCLLDIWTTLKHGGQVVLVDPDHATDAGYLLNLFADNDIHVVQAVPLAYRLLLDAAAGGGRSGGASAGLDRPHHVIVTGDSMPWRDFVALGGLFGAARLYNLYGCTETNDSFIHEVDTTAPPRSPMPLGAPLPGVDAVVVGSDGMVVEGAGVGELYVSTPFQTEGYLGSRRGETQAEFVPDPKGGSSGSRYFRSGDVVRRHGDGSVTLEGRTDFHVKVAGVRVNTEVVERAIGDHEDVVEVGVVAVPDALAGHRLHAVVRRRAGTRLNTLVLRRHCAQRLSRDAVPAVIHIVDDPLPRTSTGKVDRKRIGPAARLPEGAAEHESEFV
jgi:acyl-coenzyme A synthetase/AMP-(fatty) acid ligase